jgi:pimeloyl-ACP methyl ester carboxylesterase
MTWSN